MRYYKQIILSLIVLSCAFITGNAQEELLFRHLTRNEGLLHDNVTCIVQDSLGYMWFGSHRGLNRYDGYSIDSYKYENGIINSVYYNRVYSIQIVGRYIWLATEAGLACFDIRTKQFVSYRTEAQPDPAFYSKVRMLKQGIGNQLWLISDNQIRLVKVESSEKDNGEPVISARKIGDAYNYISDELNPKVATDSLGNAWISGKRYLSAYKVDAEGELKFSGNINNNIGSGVRDICYDNGDLWIIYQEHLAKYKIENDGSYTLAKQVMFHTPGGVLSLCVDPEYVWIGANEGLFQVWKSNESTSVMEHKHSPSNPYSVGSDINNIFLDRDNNLWVSAWTAGVSYANTRARFFKTVRYSPFRTSDTSIGSEFISSVHYSKDGHVYMGSKFGGLSSFDIRTKEVIWDYCHLPQLFPSITSIQSDSRNIYAAVRDNIVIINKKTREVTHSLRTINGGYIFWLDFDKFNRLWVTTYAGLECFEEINGLWKNTMTYTSRTPAPCNLSTDLLHNIYSDTTKNELIITSAMGINRVIFDNEGKVVRIVKYLARENDENSLSSNYIWPIDKGSDSTYWIGTMGNGLNKVTLIDRPNGIYDYSAESYGIEAGATSNDIESIEVDKFGRVWCGGFNLNYFDDGIKRFNVFDTNDGLQSYVFGTSSSAKDDEGNLYFGGAHGLNYFTPIAETPHNTSYRVYFTGCHINGKPVDSDIEFSNSLELKYPDNNFSVNFTSLSYSNQHHIRYRYKLEGYDNEWRYIEAGKEPAVAYQKIPFGSHTLLVEAGDWQIWSNEQYALQIYSQPSSAKDDEGNLYFGGAHGLNYFTPIAETPHNTSYRVYFTGCHINGKPVDSDIEFSNSLELKYPDNNFSVNFTSLSYSNQHHIRYRYKLEGYDNEWRYIEAGKEPAVAYQKIPFGSHTLLVEAGDWQIWSNEQYALQIYSQPPFWMTWWAYTLYILAILGLFYVGFRYFIKWTQMKNTISMQKEQERQKEEMMQMKMRFFTDVSHEFRTPLTLISHAINEIAEDEDICTNKYVNIIKHNTGKLSNMVNELLDFHRAEVKSAQLRTTYTSIPEYVSDIYEEFKGWAEASDIHVNLQIDNPEIGMWIDPEHFGKILSNILSNSIRYSHAGSEINIQVAKGYVNDIVPRYKDSFWNTKDMIPGEQAIIRVSDTGIGMEKAVLPTIFKRFHQVQNNTGKQHTGSGIGLSLVKSLIELHHGGIIISSKPDAGTEVIIALPISDTYLAKEEKIEESTFVLKDYLSNYAVEYEPLEIEETTAIYMEGKPTILLVDDNHEILMILREYFVKDYNIIMAIDGQEALDKCNRSLPDIIISDVMMPRMNGIELCATLKKNLQTCFIPIILLTAKSQVEDQIEGIEMGADAYIPKPFNPRLLKANVRNLLNKSHQMRNLPTANNVRQEIQDKKQREVFGKLVELVNANLTDQQFSVDHLCLELGMNRTKLYSFIKSTTGMSLGNYIRKIRLDKAAELLRTTDMSISEVGYAVGIESPSYFTRTFKEQFGSSPSEFIKH